VAVWVDTSSLYALVNADDEQHEQAHAVWTQLREQKELLLTSNYVLVETVTLIGRRLGLRSARDFQTEFVPILQVTWVDEPLHRQAVAALLTAGRRDLSLVDCVSFELMRQRGLDAAFAFDAHFVQQGFRCLPSD